MQIALNTPDLLATRGPATPSRLLLLALLLLLPGMAGCTPWGEYLHNGFKVGPNYARPAAPIAMEWIDANDKRVRTESQDMSRWWTVFNDPTLDMLVVNADQQNLTLRQAGFRVLQARAQLAIVVGNIAPQTQNVFGDYQRRAVSKKTANSSFLPTRFFDQFDLGFNLSWELDFWGRFRRAIESADADLDASVENYDDVLVTLLGDVASTYVEVRQLEQQLALVRANIILQRETLSLASARFNGGQASELDVDQAQSNLSQTESLAPQFEISLRQANNRLCILMGMPPEVLAARIGGGPIPTAPVDVAMGIPAELLTRRPDVRRAEREVAAQSAQIGIAESELYPHISVNGTVGFSAEKFTNLFKNKALQGNVGPAFQWNIFNYGRLINNVRLQDARFQELVAVYQNTVLRANGEAEDGLVLFLKSQEQVLYLAESVRAAEQAVRVALAQYRGGIVDFNRVALLEQHLVTQQDSLAQARANVATGLIQTYRALGGGWQLRLGPVMPIPLPPPGSGVATPPLKPLGEMLPVPPPDVKPEALDGARRLPKTAPPMQAARATTVAR